MTNRETIKWLKEAQSHIDLEMGGNTQEMYDALELAIKAREERPIGEWIYDDTYYDEDNPISGDIYHCSICKRSITTTLTRPTDLFPFCHCGAEMKEAENDEDNN